MKLKLFGGLFIVVGVALVALSARAISDPDSPIGWERWTDDPWSNGIFIGIGLALFGAILLHLGQRLGRRSERTVSRAVALAFTGFIGFALLAPVQTTGMCSDSVDGGGCETQDWSTITGWTFEGEPSFVLAIAGALFFIGIASGALWYLSRRR